MTTTAPSPAFPRARFIIGDWLGPAFVAVIWLTYLIVWLLDMQTFAAFLTLVGVELIMTLLFIGWWLMRPWPHLGLRFLIIAAAIVPGIVVSAASDQAMRPFLLQLGFATVLGVWAIWFIAIGRHAGHSHIVGLVTYMVLAWSAFLLIRSEGLQGNMHADVHWRWTPTAEQIYLAEKSRHSAATTQPVNHRLELRAGDWPGFRGPDRDGVVRGLSIALNWAQSPPTALWRQSVGPAWSSMAVVDGCVFTQEQHGQLETVVCRDALTGAQVWTHDEPARFEESMSGPGPRATPTFADGRIYVQGALGKLDCLDAATGRLIWSHDLRTDAGAAVPMWGFSGSPLVTADQVIVYAGGDGKKSLLAYSRDGGALLWTADAGKVSYASPQLFDVGTEHQVLIFTSEGFFAVDRGTGKPRWQVPLKPAVGVPATLQACQIGPNSLVIGEGAAFGVERIEVAPDGQSVNVGWVNSRTKPSFSDMVFHNGYIYGFDGTVFCCLDATSGTRQWREGRYGAGQVLLLADQGVMLVTSEDGQVILLRCNPNQNEELGRFQAVSGKEWNHAAIAGDRLYVRSDREMACFQLQAASGH